MGIAICAAVLCTHYFYYFLLSSSVIVYALFISAGEMHDDANEFFILFSTLNAQWAFSFCFLSFLCPVGLRVWLNFPSRFIENERALSFRTMGGENWKAYNLTAVHRTTLNAPAWSLSSAANSHNGAPCPRAAALFVRTPRHVNGATAF
jgi:hypothetical protein